MKTFKTFLIEKCVEKDRWNTYLKTNKMLKAGIDLLKEFDKIGGSSYIVGGAVRDMILGEKLHDVDIATNIQIEKLEKKFKTHDIGKSLEFGILTIRYKGFDFEVSQYRKDGKYEDGRRPETIQIVLDFKTDASRRDFTINSMGIDSDGNIIDFFDGQKDIKNKIIKTVGNPSDRFKEDKLRMMRAARFSAKLGFVLDDETKNAMKSQASDITKISIERVRDELLKAAGYGGSNFAAMLKTLDDVGILKVILPEIVKMKSFSHDPKHHPEGGVFDHVMAALEASKSKNSIVNLSILLHDIGKIATLSYDSENMPKYLGHAKEGLNLIDVIAKRLKLNNKDTETIKFAALNHMKMHNLLDMKNSTIIKLIRDKNFEVLLDVVKADEESRGSLWNPKEWDKIISKIEQVKENMKPSEYDKLKELLNGNKIMSLLNIKPGKKVGEIINDTLEYALNNNIKDSEKLYDYILSTYLKS